MNKIHQIQFQFLPVEDRLLLKINTTDKEEFSFFLTRRFVSLLHPILTKILHTDTSANKQQAKKPTSKELTDNHIHNEIVKLQPHDSIEKTNTPYQNNGLSHPLGNDPILLTNISTNTDSGELKLSLTPENGPGIRFSLDQHLTPLFHNLLLESLKITDWQLSLSTNLETSSLPTQADKRVLH